MIKMKMVSRDRQKMNKKKVTKINLKTKRKRFKNFQDLKRKR